MPETYKATPVEFRPDGTIRFTAAGRAMRLRRPSLGEYRDLREKLWQMNDEISEASEDLRVASEKLRQEIGDAVGVDDLTVSALRDLNSALTAVLVASSETMNETDLGELQRRATEFVAYLEETSGKSAADVAAAGDLDPEEKADREATMRALTRDANAAQREFAVRLDDIRLAFVRPMIDLLDVERKPLEDGQVEQWMIDPAFIQKASEHLQSVPLDRGGS